MLSTYERSVYIGQKFIVLQIQNGQDYIDVFDANKARFRKMESPSLVHQVLHRQPNFKIFLVMRAFSRQAKYSFPLTVIT